MSTRTVSVVFSIPPNVKSRTTASAYFAHGYLRPVTFEKNVIIDGRYRNVSLIFGPSPFGT